MKFLVIAAVLAYASAAPSGALYGHGAPLAVAHGALGLAHAAPLALGHAAHGIAPTISSGDIQGAAIDAHVVASDHARASLDLARNQHDQAAEFQGRAINAAEDHAWQSQSAAQTAYAAAQTAHAAADGHAAGIAPIAARQLAGHSLAHGAIAAPAYAAHSAIAAPAYAAHGAVATSYSSHIATPALAHGAYAAPVLAHGAYAAPAFAHGAYAAPALAHGAYGAAISHSTISHGAPLAHGW
ncbi:cuticle protein 16.5-like [Aricia agestis]|uniref:cuticle protein 16.5-like n=1 Tax=Aricia agestis TaxID=91739 RepID=UPI001C204059|nr:cuticle protein 16.5-like [Aricia agestis]